MNSMLNKIKFYFIFGMVTVIHFLLTFVLVLLILSTLNILNQNIMHLPGLKYLEIILTLAIVFISALVYLKSVKKLSLFIKEVILKEHIA